MDLAELKEQMKAINEEYGRDKETCHIRLDNLLLEYINDPDVTAYFQHISKWYS